MKPRYQPLFAPEGKETATGSGTTDQGTDTAANQATDTADRQPESGNDPAGEPAGNQGEEPDQGADTADAAMDATNGEAPTTTDEPPPHGFSADDRGNVVDFYDADGEMVGQIDREAEVDGVPDRKTFEAFHSAEALEAWMRANGYGDELDEIRAGYPPSPTAGPAMEWPEWFARVEKWAQFNARPIPGETPELRAAWEAGETAAEAAERICLPKP